MFQHPQHAQQRPQIHPAHYIQAPAPQSHPIYMNVPQHQTGTQSPPQSFQIRHQERQVQSVTGSQQSSQMQLPIVTNEITVIGGGMSKPVHAPSATSTYVINQHQHHPQSHPHPQPHPHPFPQQHTAGPTLIEPPTLKPDEEQANSSHYFNNSQRQQAQLNSNNQYSQFDSSHQPYNQEDQNLNDAYFWHQRCLTILQRFQWFYQRFQILRNQYFGLSQQMQNMDNQEQWYKFQQHHDDFHEKIQEMQHELSTVLEENQQLMQQKKTQQTDHVWEQRYQELLGNFKAMQQEMTHYQNSNHQQRYKQLLQNYNELQYQYTAVMNELSRLKEQSSSSVSGSISDVEKRRFDQQIQRYKKQIEDLHMENVQMNKMIQNYEEQVDSLKQQKYKSTIDKVDYEKLIKMIEEKEKEISKLQNEFKVKSNLSIQSSQFEHLFNEKSKQVEQYKRLLIEKSREAAEIKGKLSIEEETKLRFKEDLQREITEKRAKQRKISDLQKSIDELKHSSHKITESTLKIEGLEKKNTYLNQQVSNLNETLKKKNQQLIELRSQTYQLEKLRQTQNSYFQIVSQRQKLIDNLKRKSQQIEELHKQLQKMEQKVRQSTNKRLEFNSKNLLAQIQDLNEHIRKKDAEINKIKNIMQSKDQYNEKLQQEIKRLKDQIISFEQLIQNERESFREKEIRLQRKNSQYQKKIKDIDYEFSLNMKKNLQNEIIDLRKQNLLKQDRIRVLEQNQLEIKSKIPIYEKQKAAYDKDTQLYKLKIKELEESKDSILNKLDTLSAQVNLKDEDINALRSSESNIKNQVNHLKAQIQENNALLKAKNNIILQLQSQTNALVSKYNDQIQGNITQMVELKKQLSKAHEEQEKLKQIIDERENKSQVLSPKSKKQIQKLESKIVEELQAENHLLKIELSKILDKIGANALAVNNQQTYTFKSNLPSNLQKRLNEFNNKLSSAIYQNDDLSLSSVWEKERKQLLTENASLKQQLKVLKNEFAHDFSNDNQHDASIYDQQKFREQISFYKDKIKEQNQRNDNLLKVNEELKEKIESILKIKSSSTADYYKEQCLKTQQENDALRAKIKKINEQLKDCRIQINFKNTKLSQQYQTKVFELQLQIQQLNRKISYLQIQKSAIDNQRANMKHQLHNQQDAQIINNYIQTTQPPSKKLIQSPKQQHRPKLSKYQQMQQQVNSVLGRKANEPIITKPYTATNRYLRRQEGRSIRFAQ